ncbi:cold shock domain-containing protein [Streptomyces glaucus]|uniref:Cold shock domain-containing protein n=1 Tax=Streptomyces glaucus TaxID=284029 RepID=A0ABP5X4K7_9ACTN
MVVGRVVRFDGMRGYGFIAPDHGGEDVFLHVNDLRIPEQQVRPGLAVEFEVEEGERGLKASDVRLAEGPDGKPLTPPNGVARAASPGAGRQADGDESLCDVLTTGEYLHEITEILLNAAPSLTAEQILAVRRRLLQFGRDHGWTED